MTVREYRLTSCIVPSLYKPHGSTDILKGSCATFAIRFSCYQPEKSPVFLILYFALILFEEYLIQEKPLIRARFPFNF